MVARTSTTDVGYSTGVFLKRGPLHGAGTASSL